MPSGLRAAGRGLEDGDARDVSRGLGGVEGEIHLVEAGQPLHGGEILPWSRARVVPDASAPAVSVCRPRDQRRVSHASSSAQSATSRSSVEAICRDHAAHDRVSCSPRLGRQRWVRGAVGELSQQINDLLAPPDEVTWR